jgi:hypothetical protein
MAWRCMITQPGRLRTRETCSHASQRSYETGQDGESGNSRSSPPPALLYWRHHPREPSTPTPYPNH